MDGRQQEFWDLRPAVSDIERQLINALWKLRRECAQNSVIKSSDIIAELETICIESDIGLAIIQAADDYYMNLLKEEMRRKSSK
jgi:hypothetical protein